MKIKNSILVLSFFLFLATLFFYPVKAQVVTPTPEVTSVSTQTLKGKVVRVDANKLVIQSDDQTQEFSIPPSTSIKRNTFTSSVADIKPGDKVTVVYTQGGQVLSLDATSGEVTDKAKVLLPAIAVGLLALLLIRFAIARSKKSHIKTTKE